MSEFGSLLRIYRNNRGINLRVIAEHFQVRPILWNDVELGNAAPFDSLLVAGIKNYMHLTPEEEALLDEALKQEYVVDDTPVDKPYVKPYTICKRPRWPKK